MSKYYIIKFKEKNLVLDVTRISFLDFNKCEGYIDIFQNGRMVLRLWDDAEIHYNSLLSKMQKLEEANNEKDNVQR